MNFIWPKLGWKDGSLYPLCFANQWISQDILSFSNQSERVKINIHWFGIIQLPWNLPERPLLLSDHLTKIPIGSSVSQIAISEASHKRPPKPHIKGGRLLEIPLYHQYENRTVDIRDKNCVNQSHTNTGIKVWPEVEPTGTDTAGVKIPVTGRRETGCRRTVT